MHPVQAAPRQRRILTSNPRYTSDAPRAGSAEAKPDFAGDAMDQRDAPRAGSAEAKRYTNEGRDMKTTMHPVQAAPRQR